MTVVLLLLLLGVSSVVSGTKTSTNSILGIGPDLLCAIHAYADWDSRCSWSSVCSYTRQICNRMDYHYHKSNQSNNILFKSIISANWLSPFARCPNERCFSGVCKTMMKQQNCHGLTTNIIFMENSFALLCKGPESSLMNNDDDNNCDDITSLFDFEIIRQIPESIVLSFNDDPFTFEKNPLNEGWICLDYAKSGKTRMIDIDSEHRKISLRNKSVIVVIDNHYALSNPRNDPFTLEMVDFRQSGFFREETKEHRFFQRELDDENDGHYQTADWVHYQHGCDEQERYSTVGCAGFANGCMIECFDWRKQNGHQMSFACESHDCHSGFLCFKMESGMTVGLCYQSKMKTQAELIIVNVLEKKIEKSYPLISGVIEGYISPEKDYALVQTEMGEDHPRWLLYGLKDHSVSIVNCQQHSAEFVDWFTDDKFAMKWHNHEDCVVNLFSVHRPHTQLARLPPMFATAKSIGIQSDRVVCYDGSHINIVQCGKDHSSDTQT